MQPLRGSYGVADTYKDTGWGGGCVENVGDEVHARGGEVGNAEGRPLSARTAEKSAEGR